MASPFISARIPPELYKRVEKYVEETQESKTDLITKALTTYLDSHTAQKQEEAGEINSIKMKISELERRLRKVELFQEKYPSTIEESINNLQIGAGIQEPEFGIQIGAIKRIQDALKLSNNNSRFDPSQYMGNSVVPEYPTTRTKNRPHRRSRHQAVPPEETERVFD
jgi:Arc/MetJ-type ribon-helix-helix transcriptional regulator